MENIQFFHYLTVCIIRVVHLDSEATVKTRNSFVISYGFYDNSVFGVVLKPSAPKTEKLGNCV